MTRTSIGGIVATLIATCVAGSAVFAATAAAPKAKLSVKAAKAAAVKKIHGKAINAKYENEDNKWQYAVVVKTRGGQLYEVQVDPTTGAILNTEKTSAAEESKEAAEDAKAAKK